MEIERARAEDAPVTRLYIMDALADDVFSASASDAPVTRITISDE